jgi:AraC-like DNA-binding protein
MTALTVGVWKADESTFPGVVIQDSENGRIYMFLTIMSAFSRFKRLDYILHWHNPANRDPTPIVMGHGEESIELVTAGRGWVDVAGEWREVGPGDLLWHRYGEHTIGRSDPKDPYRCLGVRLSVSDDACPVRRCNRWDDLPAIRAFTTETMRLYADPTLPPAALLAWVVGTLWLRASASHAHDHPPRIRRVLELMTVDLRASLSVEDMAAKVGWSAGRLHRAFRAAVGVSPHHHRTELRLRLARELISSSDRSLQDIADHCGFANQGHFSRAFRAAYGDSPLAWRRRQGWPIHDSR